MKKILIFTFGLLLSISTIYGQVEYTVGGTPNALTLTYPSNITALTNGLTFTFKALSSNTGAVTLTVNGLLRTIKKEVNVDLVANEIRAGQIVTVVYDGTNFQMVTKSGTTISSNSSSISDVDNDTRIQVEATADEDTIKFDIGGIEYFKMAAGRLAVMNTGRSVFIGEGAGYNDDLGNNDNVFIGFNAGNATTSGNRNIAIGREALNTNTTGGSNTAIGFQSLSNANTAISSNTAVGSFTLSSGVSGGFNAAFGSSSLQNNTSGTRNTGIGAQALITNETGSFNTALGFSALNGNTGSNNTAFGSQAGDFNTTGSNNTFLGYLSDASINSLTNATAIGANAVVTQSNSMILGDTTNVNVGIGTGSPETKLHISDATDATLSGGGVIVIGNISGENMVIDNNEIMTRNNGSTSPLRLQNDGGDFFIHEQVAGGTEFTVLNSGNVGIGTLNPTQELEVVGQILTDTLSTDSIYIGDGTSVGQFLMSNGSNSAVWSTISSDNLGNHTATQDLDMQQQDIFDVDLISTDTINIVTTTNTSSITISSNSGITGAENIIIGSQAGDATTTESGNTLIGYRAGRDNTTNNNTFIGRDAGMQNTTGSNNVFVGFAAGVENLIGTSNTIMGYLAGRNMTSSGNTFIGNQAGFQNTSGTQNTYIGRYAGGSDDNSIGNETGSQNTAIGYGAGENQVGGSQNTFIGFDADASINNLTNATAIGFGSVVSQSNALILGNGADVGIGTSTPSANLEVVGDIETDSLTVDTLIIPGGSTGEVLTQSATGVARWESVTGDGNGIYGGSDFITGNTQIGLIADTLLVDLTSGTNGAFGVSTVSDTALFVNSSGNVGISNNDPQAALDVSGNILVRGGTTSSLAQPGGSIGGLAWRGPISNYGYSISGADPSLKLYREGGVQAHNIMEVYTDNQVNEVFIIDGDGKIGIGVASPQERLHLDVGADTVGLRIDGSGEITGLGIFNSNVSGGISAILFEADADSGFIQFEGGSESNLLIRNENTDGSIDLEADSILIENGVLKYVDGNEGGGQVLVSDDDGVASWATPPVSPWTEDDDTISVDATKFVRIGDGDQETSAALQVDATNKGVLVPRMTSAERIAIGSPANGLLVYQTNTLVDGVGFYYFDGVAWQKIVQKNPCFGGYNIGNGNYCIENDERAAMDYWLASTDCMDEDRRLCSFSEWYHACNSGTGINTTNNWEWIEYGGMNNAHGVGDGGDCKSISIFPKTTGNTYRCCYSR